MGIQIMPASRSTIMNIPEDCTAISNKWWKQHQADGYSEAEDAVRITVTLQTSAGLTERLQYGIGKTGENAAIITISWESFACRLHCGSCKKCGQDEEPCFEWSLPALQEGPGKLFCSEQKRQKRIS